MTTKQALDICSACAAAKLTSVHLDLYLVPSHVLDDLEDYGFDITVVDSDNDALVRIGFLGHEFSK